MKAIGIRDVRQNLSVYLRRVKEGDRFTVTDRGKPVATLGPPPGADDLWERLIAEGAMTPPSLDLEHLPPPLELDHPYALTNALREQRRDRRA